MAPNTSAQTIDFEEVKPPIGEMSYPDLEQQKRIEFDPSKNYGWQPTDKFEFNGQEFHVMYNNLAEFMSTPTTPANIIKLSEVFAIMQAKFMRMVQDGMIKEQPNSKASIKATETATGEPVEQNANPKSEQ